MGFVEDNGVSGAVLATAAEHVLIDAVEGERRVCPLNGCVLRFVNLKDNRPRFVEQASPGTGTGAQQPPFAADCAFIVE